MANPLSSDYVDLEVDDPDIHDEDDEPLPEEED